MINNQIGKMGECGESESLEPDQSKMKVLSEEAVYEPVEEKTNRTLNPSNSKLDCEMDNLVDYFREKLDIKKVAVENDEDYHEITAPILKKDTDLPPHPKCKENCIQSENETFSPIIEKIKDDLGQFLKYSNDDSAEQEKRTYLANDELICRGPDRTSNGPNHRIIQPYYIPKISYPSMVPTGTLDLTHAAQMSGGKILQSNFSDLIIDYAENTLLPNGHVCGNKDDLDEGYATGSPDSSPYGTIPSPLDGGNSSSASENERSDILEPLSSWFPTSCQQRYVKDTSACIFNSLEDPITEGSQEDILPREIYKIVDSLMSDYSRKNPVEDGPPEDLFSKTSLQPESIQNILPMNTSSCQYAQQRTQNPLSSHHLNCISNGNITNTENISFEIPQTDPSFLNHLTNLNPIIPPSNCSQLNCNNSCQLNTNINICPEQYVVTKIREIRPKKRLIHLSPKRNATEWLLSLMDDSKKRNAWFWVANSKKEKLFAQDEEGDTNLHISVCHQNVEMIYAIVRFYEKYNEQHRINIKNQIGQTALYLATVTNQPAVVAFLLDYGADVNTQVYKCNDSNSPLHAAASRGEFFRETLEQLCYIPNIKIDVQNASGHTPLQTAIQSHGKKLRLDCSTELVPINSINTVAFLLSIGADPLLKDSKTGKCALHFAAEARDPNMIQVFCDFCSNIRNIINCRTSYGETPLHFAARLKSLQPALHIRILRKLFDCGADPSLRCKDNKKPVQLVESSNKAVIHFLQGKGCSRLQAI